MTWMRGYPHIYTVMHIGLGSLLAKNGRLQVKKAVIMIYDLSYRSYIGNFETRLTWCIPEHPKQKWMIWRYLVVRST
jgi:hypothetical protein